MRTTMFLVVALAFAIPVVALAHESGLHGRGTIKEITPHHVVLAAKDGEQTYALGPDTKLVRGERAVRPDEVRVGERAVVHARRDGEKLHATEIRLAPAGAGSKGGSRKEKRP